MSKLPPDIVAIFSEPFRGLLFFCPTLLIKRSFIPDYIIVKEIKKERALQGFLNWNPNPESNLHRPIREFDSLASSLRAAIGCNRLQYVLGRDRHPDAKYTAIFFPEYFRYLLCTSRGKGKAGDRPLPSWRDDTSHEDFFFHDLQCARTYGDLNRCFTADPSQAGPSRRTLIIPEAKIRRYIPRWGGGSSLEMYNDERSQHYTLPT